MGTFKALVGVLAGVCLASALAALTAGPALAAGTKVCVPKAEGAAVVTAKAGACEAGYTKTTLLAEPEREKLEKILPYVDYTEKGIGGKPTIEFSEVNVQVIDGAGSESKVNGEGNLIIGYDEAPSVQSGSHDLILGGPKQTYSSYGGIDGGYLNTISAPDASVLSGAANIASGAYSMITGGFANKATATDASVYGGCGNLAGGGTFAVNPNCTGTTLTDEFTSVIGGVANHAEAQGSTVSGGGYNLANALYSSIAGGLDNRAEAEGSSVSGGQENLAAGQTSSVSGGNGNSAIELDSSVSGGEDNTASGDSSSVSGGSQNTAGFVAFGFSGRYSSVSGGEHNAASGLASSVGGGHENQAKAKDSGILAGNKKEALVEYEGII